MRTKLILLVTLVLLSVSYTSVQAQCTSTVSSFPYFESFENDLGGWTGNISTSIPPAFGFWGRRSGSTSSNYTGPTSATNGSFYAYTETSTLGSGATLDFNSPCFQLPSGGLSTFSFDYHMWSDPSSVTGNGMGIFCLLIDTTLSGVGTWDTLWIVNGNQGNLWHDETVNLSAYSNNTVRLKFRAVTGSGGFVYAGDRAIDNLQLNTTGLNTTPIYCVGGNNGALSVINEVLTAPITYAWNTGATTSTITNLSAGSYTVTVTDATSTYVLTETLADGTVPVINQYPYAHGFEDSNFNGWFNDSLYDVFDWSINSGTTPTGFTGPTGANQGNNYAYTEASGIANNSSAWLTSPCFDLSNIIMPYLKFDYNMYSGAAASTMGSLFITADTTPTSPFSQDTIWSKTGSQGTSWLSDSIDLSAYAGNEVTIRFIGLTGTGTSAYGDRAIDGIEVKSAFNVTAACGGSSGGSISVSPLVGTSPYSYSWSTGGSGSSISGLAAGTYTVTITDNLSQTYIQSITVDTNEVPVATGLAATVTEYCENVPVPVTLSIDYINGNAIFNGSSATLNDAGPSGSVGSNVNFTINGTPALATGDAILTISARGDLEAPGEFIRTISENGDLIGITENENGQCNAAYSQNAYIIPADSINVWAQDDTLAFLAESFGMTRYCGIGGGQAFSFQAFYSITYPYTTTIPYWFADSCGTDTNNAIGKGFFVEVMPTTTTTYYVRYYDQYCAEWGDCDSITITVHPIPTLSVSPANSTYCTTPIALSATGANTWNWIPGTGLNNSNTANVLASPSSTTTYNIVGTDMNSCFDTIQATVNVVPPINASITIDSNASCNGSSDGGLSVSVTGGSGMFTYLWSNGQTTPSISGLSAATYTVTVTDTTGCSDVVSAAISQPTPVSAILNGNDPCNGGANGSITAIGTGGAGGYSYAWSNGQTTATTFGLTAGTYTVTVTDANGCTGTNQTTLVNSTLTLAMSQDSVSCFGGNNGSATATPSGGTPPYFYNWLNSSFSSIGQFSQTATGLTAGQYFVQVSSSNGCNVFSGIFVQQPATAVSVAITSSNNVTCNGGSDGSATANTTGGVGFGYTYLWSNGDTTASISGLTAGTYIVSSTDGNGCIDTTQVTITEPAIVAGTMTPTNVSCFGGNDGQLTVSPSGGSGSGYSYSWSNGQTNATAVNLTAGTYTVTITDANGCTGTSIGSVTEPTLLVASATSTNALCNGGTGNATASATGGTGTYTYAWSNGATTATASSLAAGTFTVTITDANGCFDTAQVNITEPSAVLATIILDSNVSCNGGSNGAATASATGGTGAFTYSWNNGQTSASASGLTAGTYSVTVTDANGCTDSSSITISEPTAITASTTITNNASCNGATDGSAFMNASGGTMPYSYMWSNGQTLANATGLAAGTYTVTLTDGNGCTATSTAVITEPNAITLSFSSTNVSCNGGTNGTATATATGGTGTFNYAWSASAGSATTATVSGLSAGWHFVTATDGNGCTGIDSIEITEPNLISSTTTFIHPFCDNTATGSATVTPSGGTPNYTYLWSNGSTQNTIRGLNEGSYSVTVTDANGCTSIENITLTDPAPVDVSATGTDLLCNGDSSGLVVASITNGVENSYLSLNGTTQYIEVPYSPSLSMSNNFSIETWVKINGPNAGTNIQRIFHNTGWGFGIIGNSAIRFTTFGINDFDQSYSFTYGQWYHVAVTFNASNDARFYVNGNYVGIIYDATPANTTTSNSYIGRLNNSTNEFVNGDIDEIRIWNTTLTGSAIAANYCNSDLANHPNINSLVARWSFNEGASTTVSGGVSNINAGIVYNNPLWKTDDQYACFNTDPFAYNWSNGVVNDSILGASAGSYTVTVYDGNGCFDTTSIAITEPDAIIATAFVDNNVSCNNGSDGVATASAVGGIGAYTYSWSNGATTASSTGLSAGVHTVTITDANGCTDTATVTITEPMVIATSITIDSNVNCNGGNDGGATILATGGTGTFTYSWSASAGSATTASVSGLSAGTHTVTISDANGCSAIDSVTLTEPSVLLATVSGTNLTCNGSGDGSASASVSGGTSPYTYSWNTGATSASIASLSIGTYTVTITDANGCTASSSTTLTEPSTINYSSTLINGVSCFGGSDGSALIIPFGGTSPYTYLWPSGETNDTAFALSAGGNTVTITDANGCTENGFIFISEPSAISLSATVDSNVSCFGGNDGGATVSASGGASGFSYLWSNGQTGSSATSLAAGIHSVTVTDANGCTDSTTITITEPSLLSAAAAIDSNATCNGANDGGASVVAIGGTPSYTYSWNNGASASSISGVAAGTYSVTITDANGCTDSASVTITEPISLIATTSIDSIISCAGGNNGAIAASAIGGTTPFTYNWNNGQTAALAIGLSAGTYSVTITDANGCSDSASTTLIEPAPLLVSTSVDSNASCNGLANGGATATASGGTAPYSYQWSNGDTSAVATGLSAGNHTVTATDANGCVALSSITITEPTLLSASATIDSNATCAGLGNGGATASAVGGTPNYTYAWNNGATTASITGILAGTYSVTITDQNGCTDSSSVIITEPSAVLASISIDSNVSCNGASDGGLSASATGGSGGYLYTWNNLATTAAITGISAGTYSVTITDANGCTDSSSAVVSEPTSLNASVTLDSNVSCNGGNDASATASITGGTAPYTYSWSNSQTSATAAGLAASSYSVTITDANGCTDSASVIVSEPTLLTASTVVDSNASCFNANDGGASASAIGGTLPYSYNWSNGVTTASISNVNAGTYNVTITDANGCIATSAATITEPTILTANAALDSNVSCFNGSNGGATASATGGTGAYTYSWSNAATTASVTGVSAGTYSITISDANGCTDSASVIVSEPTLLITMAMVDSNASCNGASDGGITATGTGGTGLYTYSWSNGATTASVSGIAAGTYSVTITDANGCTDSTSATISEPSILSSIAAVDSNISCNGGNDGQASVTATGGTTPYSYSWNNGQTAFTATGLTAGTYSVTVTDANGCTDSTSITINEPAALLATATADSNATCFAFANGGATATASGGTSPYSYNWNNAATTASITGVLASTYSVTITDANGCTDSSSVIITEPTILDASITLVNNVSCFGGSNGEATGIASGGTAPYTYSWSDGNTNATNSSLASGNYTITITDANGCFDTASITISEPTELNAAASPDSTVSCFGLSDGGASAIATNGTPTYTYSWNTGATSVSIAGLAVGTYSVTVTDANGCTDSSSIFISQPDSLVASIIVDSNVSCFGGNDGSATATAIGGTASYFYTWNNGDTDAIADSIGAGTYAVTITDQNGCTDTSSVLITEPAAIITTITLDSNVSCFGGNDGAAHASATGGTGTISFSWDNGTMGSQLSSASAGWNYLVATDANGCNAFNAIQITEPDTFVYLNTTLLNAPLCFGDSNGSAVTTAAGGFGPYSYLWETGETNDTALLAAGTWSLTAIDANGCEAIDSITINDPLVAVASIDSIVNVSCNGLADGKLFASANGGAGGYTYSWSAGGTNDSITGLAVGNYTLTVADANGCVDTATASITEPDTISASFTVNNATCNGLFNGSLIVSASGGNGSYSYQWSNGITIDSIGGLMANSYTVTITDALGCNNTFTETVSQPSELFANIFYQTSNACNGDSGAIAVANATGGTAPYTYAWPSGFMASNDTVFGLPAGVVIVTVTDANGCTDTNATIISEPTAVTLNLVAQQNATCVGGNDGSLDVQGVGGTGSYSFAWSNSATGSSINGLSAGVYTVTAADGNGCIGIDSFTITEINALPMVNLGSDIMSCDSNEVVSAGAFNSYVWNTSETTAAITVSTAGTYTVTVTDTNGCQNSDAINIGFHPSLSYDVNTDSSACGLANGNASIVALTGGGGYNINWSSGQVGGLMETSLSSGNYVVSVTDQNGCELNTPFTIYDESSLNLVVTSINVSCFNGSNGAASISSLTGGSAPYSYLWSNGDTSSSINGLIPGTYDLTVTDSNGCSTFGQGIVSNALPINFDLNATDASCGDSNGVAWISNLTPAGSYTYLWNDYQNQTTDTAFTIPAGNYSVTVTNDNGCTKVKSTVLNNDSAAVLTMSSINNACENGNTGLAIVQASGNGPFNYQWNDAMSQTTDTASALTAGTYFVTVTDVNGCISVDSVEVLFNNATPVVNLGNDTAVCANFYLLSAGTGFDAYNWSNGSTNTTISANTSNIYSVTVTDSNGCEAVDSINLILNAPIAYTSTVTNSNCNSTSGEIDVNVIGGGGSYVYNWSTGDTTALITSIGGGTYDLTITDANGCSANTSFTVSENNAPTLSAIVDNPNCNGQTDGSVIVSTTGGTWPFNFNWSNGDTDSIANNVGAGNYSLTVTDDSGCVATANYTLTEPAAINFSFVSTNSTCGNADGSVLATVTGTQGPASYTWNDPAMTDSIFLQNVSAGTYSLVVIDSVGCIDSSNAIVMDDNAPIVSTGSINNTCENDSNGVAYAIATGNGPFGFLWNDPLSQANDTASFLTNGNYQVSVTDANGCLAIASTNIGSFYDQPEVNLGGDIATCIGNEIILTPGGGFTAYAWNTGATTVDLYVTSNGLYSVTATDLNTCSNSDTVEVVFNQAPAVDLGNDTLICIEDGTPSFTLDAGSGFSGYEWNTSETTSTIDVSTTGLYTVTVSTGIACEASDFIFVVFDTCINVGADEIVDANSPSISLYPNPNRGAFVLETQGLTPGNYVIQLTNYNGQVVTQRRLGVESSDVNRSEFNLSNIARGVYILSIEGNEQVLYHRVIIQ